MFIHLIYLFIAEGFYLFLSPKAFIFLSLLSTFNSNNPILHRKPHHFEGTVNAKFSEDIRFMPIYGSGGDVEAVGDHFCRESLLTIFYDMFFLFGELGTHLRCFLFGDVDAVDDVGDVSSEVFKPLHDRAYGFDEHIGSALEFTDKTFDADVEHLLYYGRCVFGGDDEDFQVGVFGFQAAGDFKAGCVGQHNVEKRYIGNDVAFEQSKKLCPQTGFSDNANIGMTALYRRSQT